MKKAISEKLGVSSYVVILSPNGLQERTTVVAGANSCNGNLVLAMVGALR